MNNKFIIAAGLILTGYFMQSCGNSNNSSAEGDMDSSMTHKMQND